LVPLFVSERKLPWERCVLKQVFARRYNRAKGREGHIWGERYRSLLLDEPVIARGAAAKQSRQESPRRGMLGFASDDGGVAGAFVIAGSARR
jgi:hypothetical protein